LLCVYGGLAVLIIYGLLMDTASVTMVGQDLSWQAFAASYATGFPFNVIHAVSTVIFLFFMAVPMERKLDRIRKKYGILEV
ncbi:MAG: ECF transporter S component, partial [Bacillota bacterium]|nr:ECF transporter S component [Bacillota bacterium]